MVRKWLEPPWSPLNKPSLVQHPGSCLQFLIFQTMGFRQHRHLVVDGRLEAAFGVGLGSPRGHGPPSAEG